MAMREKFAELFQTRLISWVRHSDASDENLIRQLAVFAVTGIFGTAFAPWVPHDFSEAR